MSVPGDPHLLYITRDSVYPRDFSQGGLRPVIVAHSDYCRALAQEKMDAGTGPGLTMPLVEYTDRLQTPPAAD